MNFKQTCNSFRSIVNQFSDDFDNADFQLTVEQFETFQQVKTLSPANVSTFSHCLSQVLNIGCRHLENENDASLIRNCLKTVENVLLHFSMTTHLFLYYIKTFNKLCKNLKGRNVCEFIRFHCNVLNRTDSEIIAETRVKHKYLSHLYLLLTTYNCIELSAIIVQIVVILKSNKISISSHLRKVVKELGIDLETDNYVNIIEKLSKNYKNCITHLCNKLSINSHQVYPAKSNEFNEFFVYISQNEKTLAFFCQGAILNAILNSTNFEISSLELVRIKCAEISSIQFNYLAKVGLELKFNVKHVLCQNDCDFNVEIECSYKSNNFNQLLHFVLPKLFPTFSIEAVAREAIMMDMSSQETDTIRDCREQMDIEPIEADLINANLDSSSTDDLLSDEDRAIRLEVAIIEHSILRNNKEFAEIVKNNISSQKRKKVLHSFDKIEVVNENNNTISGNRQETTTNSVDTSTKKLFTLDYELEGNLEDHLSSVVVEQPINLSLKKIKTPKKVTKKQTKKKKNLKSNKNEKFHRKRAETKKQSDFPFTSSSDEPDCAELFVQNKADCQYHYLIDRILVSLDIFLHNHKHVD